MNYEIIVDKLMSHFSRGRYEAEILSAKDNFLQSAGVFDESQDDFEVKMSQFVEWYLFDRKLEIKDAEPIAVALENEDYLIPDELVPYYYNLKSHTHSLFEFLKFKSDEVYIRDLFTKNKYIIKKSPIRAGFIKGAYFEARIIPHEDYYVFSRSFCMHPKDVGSFILKEVKKAKKVKKEKLQEEQKELIQRLFKMKHKTEQYRHLSIKEIYSNDSLLGL